MSRVCKLVQAHLLVLAAVFSVAPRNCLRSRQIMQALVVGGLNEPSREGALFQGCSQVWRRLAVVWG